MTLTVRTAQACDVEVLVGLETRCFKGVYAAHRFGRREFMYYVRATNASLLVAEDTGCLGGYLLGSLGTGRRRRSGRILSVAVEGAFRRRGVARDLFERFLALARRGGHSRITGEVWVRNRAALALFEQFGFRRSEYLPDYYGRSSHAVRLRRVDDDR